MRFAVGHRSILAVDIEGYAQLKRTSHDQVSLRRTLSGMLNRAFDLAGIDRASLSIQDLGDGSLILVQPDVAASALLDMMCLQLAAELRAHNRHVSAATQIRLRVVFHAGVITEDQHGATGDAVVLAFRLLDSNELRACMAASTAPLAVVVSDELYQTVVRQGGRVARAESYRPISVMTKEVGIKAWVWLPEHVSTDAQRRSDRRVFISRPVRLHSQAYELAEELRARDYIVFDMSMIEPGENWVTALRQQIDEADLFVFLLEGEHIEGWQSRELLTALESYWDSRDKRIVVVAGSSDQVPPVLRQSALILEQGAPADWAEALDDTNIWFKRYDDDARANQSAALYQSRVESVGLAATGAQLATSEIGEYQESLEREIARRPERFGEENPQNADVLHRLATAHYELGELARARELLERALQIREGQLGLDHPSTAASAHSLGSVLSQLGELARARELLARAYDTNLVSLGLDHPSTAASAHSLGLVLSQLGEIDEAYALLTRALEATRRALGPDSPECQRAERALRALRQAKDG